MTNERREVLELLGRVGELAPEVRLGQLLCHLAFQARGPWNETLWDLEDGELLLALRDHVRELEERSPAATSSASH